MSQFCAETEFSNRTDDIQNVPESTSHNLSSSDKKPESDCLQEVKEQQSFPVGSKCLIKSQSQNQWYLGLVVNVDHSMITVKYFVEGKNDHATHTEKRQKELDLSKKRESELIKQFSPSCMSFIKTPRCLCKDKPVMKKLPKSEGTGQCDYDGKEENEELEPDKSESAEAVFTAKFNAAFNSDEFNDPADVAVREKLMEIQTRLASIDDDDVDDSRDDDNILCSVCHNEIDDNLGYYCPNGKNAIHENGFNLCLNCVMDNIGFSMNRINNNVKDEIESTTNDNNEFTRKGKITAEKPFARGSSMYAYLGTFRNGQMCVLKKYVNEHVMRPETFDAEFRCFSTASELVNKWNQLNIVSKKYVLIKPDLSHKGCLEDLFKILDPELFEQSVSVEVKKDENENDLSVDVEENTNINSEKTTNTKQNPYKGKLLDKLVSIYKEYKASQKSEDEIVCNEFVMVEPYLNGKFTKWNSNGGWQNPSRTEASVQAFCHWTYHESNEQLLFCDAQGISKFDEYILTDPCIVSNKNFARDKNGNIIDRKEETYGMTDAGREFLLNWFRNHKCNKFCDKNWAKPTELEIENIPAAVKNADKVRSSVFNSLVQGIGSVTLGNGSVLVGQEIRNNFTIDGIDYANSNHIDHKQNERIIKIGKMNFIDKKNDENEDCVMILTTWNKIIVVWTNTDNQDDDDDDDEDEDLEFTKKKVKQTALVENNEHQFRIVVKKGGRKKAFETHFFECKDGRRAQEWKRDIDKAFDLH